MKERLLAALRKELHRLPTNREEGFDTAIRAAMSMVSGYDDAHPAQEQVEDWLYRLMRKRRPFGNKCSDGYNEGLAAACVILRQELDGGRK